MPAMPTLYVMIGPPGCGKSYYAEKIHGFNGAKIVGSDDIRKNLYGDETIQKNHGQVFSIAHYLIAEELREGRSVIFDATNVTRDNRAKLFQALKGIKRPFYICGLVYRGALTECLERNLKRERKVPEDVIRKMWTQLRTSPPELGEGFDALTTLSDRGTMFLRCKI